MAPVGKAPAGFHTVVKIRVTLKGGRTREAEWDTPMALPAAYHKALGWLTQDMREEGVPAFRKPKRVQIDVFYEEGEYQSDAET